MDFRGLQIPFLRSKGQSNGFRGVLPLFRGPWVFIGKFDPLGVERGGGWGARSRVGTPRGGGGGPRGPWHGPPRPLVCKRHNSTLGIGGESKNDRYGIKR